MNEHVDELSTEATNIVASNEEATTEAVEEWRPVVGYEGLYEVSSLGRVRNARTIKFVQISSPKGGCCAVRLYDKASHVHSLPLHEVVALAF